MKIACLLGQGFEDSEFRIPYDRLKKEGYQVDVIGAKAGEELKGSKGKERVKVEKSIDQVKADDYDALLIPGGQSPDHLRVDKRFVDFVRAFEVGGKLIAAVCHGPQLLIAAHLVKGRTLTAWATIQDDLEQEKASHFINSRSREGREVSAARSRQSRGSASTTKIFAVYAPLRWKLQSERCRGHEMRSARR